MVRYRRSLDECSILAGRKESPPRRSRKNGSFNTNRSFLMILDVLFLITIRWVVPRRTVRNSSLTILMFVVCQDRWYYRQPCGARIDFPCIRLWSRPLFVANSAIKNIRCAKRKLQQGATCADDWWIGCRYHGGEAESHKEKATGAMVSFVVISVVTHRHNYLLYRPNNTRSQSICTASKAHRRKTRVRNGDGFPSKIRAMASP